MVKVTNIDELNIEEDLIYVPYRGEPIFYKFLMVHPRHKGYALLLTNTGDVKRMDRKEISEHIYKDYDTLDLLIIKKDNAIRALKEVEEALLELKLTGKTYNVL